MAAAMGALKGLGLPFGAYANGFSEISHLPLPEDGGAPAYCARHDLSPERYVEFAMSWVAMGATIVGGCCEVGPAHITALAKALRDAGHVVV